MSAVEGRPDGYSMLDRPRTSEQQAEYEDMLADQPPPPTLRAEDGWPDPRDDPGWEDGVATPDGIRTAEHEALVPSTAAAIVPRRVEWTWRGHIPLGKVTMLDGRPGLGKSCMSLDIAARVSRGQAMPDGSSGPLPSNVIVITAEDDWADTIVPRLMVAGADLTRTRAGLDYSNVQRVIRFPPSGRWPRKVAA